MEHIGEIILIGHAWLNGLPNNRMDSYDPSYGSLLSFGTANSAKLMTGRKTRALQVPLLGKFPKALYGTTGGIVLAVHGFSVLSCNKRLSTEFPNSN